MQVLKFGYFGQRWQPADELYIVVSDTGRFDVSTAHPVRLKEVMAQANFGTHINPEVRARQLIVSSEDKISKITDLHYRGSVEIEPQVWRHFVFVAGHDFCFKERLGREFITTTSNLTANLGLINGPVVEDIIQNLVPHTTILTQQ